MSGAKSPLIHEGALTTEFVIANPNKICAVTCEGVVAMEDDTDLGMEKLIQKMRSLGVANDEYDISPTVTKALLEAHFSK